MSCSEVRDISSLGKVEELSITWCENISDISCLTALNSLTISLRYITRGLEVLENVKDCLALHDGYKFIAALLNKLKASHIKVINNKTFSDTSLLVT